MKIILSLCLLILTQISLASPTRMEAIFAGGCFWCMQADFDKVPGVVKTIAGYAGGQQANPTYRQVASGRTRYVEAVKVVFNPNKVSYDKLLQVFWRNIDPTDDKGQFCDRGFSYTTAIFYLTPKQGELAKASKQAILDSQRFNKVATRILAASTFYPAESYHQSYYKKKPLRYKYYRYNCGRDHRLKKLWGN